MIFKKYLVYFKKETCLFQKMLWVETALILTKFQTSFTKKIIVFKYRHISKKKIDVFFDFIRFD